MKLIPILALSAAIGFGAHSAQAATATGTMAVTAAVADSCTVAATALGFGTLSSGAVTNELAPAVVTVVCTSAKTGASITLDAGLNDNAGQRRMVDAGSNMLPYDVFSDSAHTSSVAAGGALYNGDLTAIVPTTVNVYGQVPAGAYAFGAYADAVTVTLNY